MLTISLTIFCTRCYIEYTYIYIYTCNICYSYSQNHEEINHLKSVWQKNSPPLFFINNCVQNVLNKLLIKRVENSTTTQKKKITISLKYLRKISLLAKKQLPNILEIVVKVLNLTPFSKHQIDSATH